MAAGEQQDAADEPRLEWRLAADLGVGRSLEMMVPQAQRLLIAATRVPGSTKACTAHGDLATFATLQTYYAIAAEEAAGAGGRFVKAMGDSVLLTFPLDRTDGAVAALHHLQERATILWRQFDQRCYVQVKGRVGSVLAGMLGAPGEEHFDVVGDAVNQLFKAPWHDFDVSSNGSS
jgi:class 3 adenylate cyclase